MKASTAVTSHPAWLMLHDLSDDYGIVLMGRRTYEAEVQQGALQVAPTLMTYVFSRSPIAKTDEHCEMIHGEAVDWVRRLKTCPGRDLCVRGAVLATSLLEAGLIDEVVVRIIPILQGSGERVFNNISASIGLERMHSVTREDGSTVITYRAKNVSRSIQS